MIQYHCPNCGSPDHLDVVILVFGRLIQTEDNIETDTDGHDHEWDGNSACQCECGWGGLVDDTLEEDDDLQS